jgi:hypothetical protein
MQVVCCEGPTCLCRESTRSRRAWAWASRSLRPRRLRCSSPSRERRCSSSLTVRLSQASSTSFRCRLSLSSFTSVLFNLLTFSCGGGHSGPKCPLYPHAPHTPSTLRKKGGQLQRLCEPEASVSPWFTGGVEMGIPELSLRDYVIRLSLPSLRPYRSGQWRDWTGSVEQPGRSQEPWGRGL